MKRNIEKLEETIAQLKTHCECIESLYNKYITSEEKSSYMLLDTYGKVLDHYEKYKDLLNVVLAYIKIISAESEFIDAFRHVINASVISAPLLLLAPDDLIEPDIKTAILTGDITAAIGSIAFNINCQSNYVKFANVLTDPFFDGCQEIVTKQAKYCFDEILDKVNKMEDLDNIALDDDFVHNMANCAILNAFKTRNIEESLMLPYDVRSEMISILQKDLNTDESDLVTLYKTAIINLETNLLDHQTRKLKKSK